MSFGTRGEERKKMERRKIASLSPATAAKADGKRTTAAAAAATAAIPTGVAVPSKIPSRPSTSTSSKSTTTHRRTESATASAAKSAVKVTELRLPSTTSKTGSSTPPEKTPRPEQPPPAPVPAPSILPVAPLEDDFSGIGSGPEHEACRERIRLLTAQNDALVARQKKLISTIRSLALELQHSLKQGDQQQVKSSTVLEGVEGLIIE